MNKDLRKLGVKAPNVMLPAGLPDLELWPVVACDQHTSEPEYWERVGERVGNSPSTLRLILPEIYIGDEDVAERVTQIHSNMERYVKDGVLRDIGEGFVLVRRTFSGKTRVGLMAALDLERYDFSASAKSLIRATEGTIEERIPPRLMVREGATLELPHALVLVDDPGRTLIEPLEPGEKLYDVELMENGGRVEGYFIAPEKCGGFAKALKALAGNQGDSADALLFAVGDGNHSLAAAKTAWEKRKKSIPKENWENDPARFTLVELVNVHDESVVFEAIHRVVTGVKPMAFLSALCEKLPARCAIYDDEEQLNSAMAEPFGGQRLPFVFEGSWGVLLVENPAHPIAYGTLQSALDAVLGEESGGTIDYVHGDGVVRELGSAPSSVGFILPALGKSELFETVKRSGALPRKSFSMGHANEKRFYMEARSLL